MIRNILCTLFVLLLITLNPLSGQQQKHNYTHIVGKENDAKKLRRYSMTENDVDAFLWVEQSLFKWLVKNNVDITLAKARTEIATAKAFNIEPSNWAKRDIGVYVETQRAWEKKKDDVERRLKAAREYSRKVSSDMIKNGGNNINPIKMGAMYWFSDPSDKEPNSPYAPLAKAYEKEHKIEYEREQLYHQFNKETPEEKVGGAFAILLSMVMLDAAFGESGLSTGAKATLRTLGKTRVALALNESKMAMKSIMDARSILIGVKESRAALIAVEAARTALIAGEIEMVSSAVKNAQSILSAQLKVNPGVALVLATTKDAIARLDSVEKDDVEIGIKEKDKIDLFDYSSKHQSDVKQFLDKDFKAAIELKAQYSTLVAEGKITFLELDNKVKQKETINEIIPNKIQRIENTTNHKLKRDNWKEVNAVPSRVSNSILGIVNINNKTSLTFLIYDSTDKLVNVVRPHQRKKLNLNPGNYYHVGGGNTKYFKVKEGKSLSLNFLRRFPIN